MADPKKAHTLVTYFGTKYAQKYSIKPVVNRYSARWGFDSMLMDMSVEEAKKLIDYYLSTVSTNGHSLEWFFYNYEKLAVAMAATEEDAQALARIREETRIRTEEWRRKRGLDN